MSATNTDGVAVSATLSTTTVDTAVITGNYRVIEVANRAAAGGADIWFNYGLGAAPAAPSTGGAGCYWVPAASSLAVRVIDVDEDADIDKYIKVVGSGNAYTVSGVSR